MSLRSLRIVFLCIVAVFPTVYCDEMSAHEPNKVEETKIAMLHFSKGKITLGRRNPGILQLNCVGGTANCRIDALPNEVTCYNGGVNPDNQIKWHCISNIGNWYQLGEMTVVCEGYDYAEDPFVLVGSCGLEYTLDTKTSIWVYYMFAAAVGLLLIYEVKYSTRVGFSFWKTFCTVMDGLASSHHRSAADVKYTALVKLLVEDGEVVRQWRMVAGSIGLPPSDIHDLDQGYKAGTMSGDEVYDRMISKWNSRQGETATVEKLAEILKENQLVNSSERIVTLGTGRIIYGVTAARVAGAAAGVTVATAATVVGGSMVATAVFGDGKPEIQTGTAKSKRR